MISRLEQLQKFLEEEPADTFTHYAIALEYIAKKNHDEAIAKFEEVLALDPNYVAAYHQLGLLYVRMNMNDDARKILEQGIRVAGQISDAHARAEMENALDALET
jgi:tetratricopeptide (TPR) repeat protein